MRPEAMCTRSSGEPIAYGPELRSFRVPTGMRGRALCSGADFLPRAQRLPACGSVGGPGDHVPGAACTRTLGQLISYGPELLSCRIPSVCGAGPCVRPPTRQPGRLAFRELSARGRAAIGGRSRRLRTASPRVHTRGDGMAGRTGADGTARRADVSRQSAGVPLHARRLRRACAGRYKPHAVRPGCEDTWGTRCSLAPVRLPGRRW